MSFSDAELSDILVKDKLLTKRQVAEYLDNAGRAEASLQQYLIAENILERVKIGQAVAQALNVKYIDLNKIEIKPELFQSVSEFVAKKNKVVAFNHDQEGLHIAMANPTDQEFISNFQKKSEDKLVIYYAEEESIDDILNKYHFSNNEEFNLLIQQIISSGEETSRAEDLPIIKIVDKMLHFGYTSKSSDIHIEPYEDKTVIRFRIDGMLHDILIIPMHLHELIVTRIKILARLRTDEHRAAQDGKLKFSYGDEKVDVRVSIVPIVHGEKVVMRLLSEKARQYELEKLGFGPKYLEMINKNIKRPWGMILATGPTGCGKTTTLYAIIQKLNKREVNIATIEDPVEYDMEGVNQIQVNPKTNLTFSAGLRSLVRQDPDIIMVGEIRDEETAKIAINSAMTGHLVLSTLHTNDSATTLPRLIDMGIQPFLVASTVNIAIGQRLVRRICVECKYKAQIDDQVVELVKKELSPDTIKKYKLDDKKTIIYYGKGCEACQYTGFKGRVGIYEVLEMNDQIKELIMNQANSDAIKAKAIEQGMVTMIEDGIAKVLDGQTTINEILRVSQE
ncbi:MAG: ATPase, T2SS/T4P/T4SS family [Patescibacteria group bacterium]